MYTPREPIVSILVYPSCQVVFPVG